MSPVKIRYSGPRSESTPYTTRDDRQDNSEWSPVKLRYIDAFNEVVPTTTPRDPKENDHSSESQGKLSDERVGKQPGSHFDKVGKYGGGEDDDGFSISAL
jgi:hypothetical protein